VQEALLRWITEFGNISPMEFYSYCRRNSMIKTRLTVDYAHCHRSHVNNGLKAGHKDLLVAINLSAVQFNKPLLVNMIMAHPSMNIS